MICFCVQWRALGEETYSWLWSNDTIKLVYKLQHNVYVLLCIPISINILFRSRLISWVASLCIVECNFIRVRGTFKVSTRYWRATSSEEYAWACGWDSQTIQHLSIQFLVGTQVVVVCAGLNEQKRRSKKLNPKQLKHKHINFAKK